MVEGYMNRPKWKNSVYEKDKNNDVVTATGKVTYLGKEVEASLQFLVNKANGNFVVAGLEINGASQNQLVAAALLKNMCQ